LITIVVVNGYCLAIFLLLSCQLLVKLGERALKRVWLLPLVLMFKSCTQFVANDRLMMKFVEAVFAFNCLNCSCTVVRDVCKMLVDDSCATSLLCKNVKTFLPSVFSILCQ